MSRPDLPVLLLSGFAADEIDEASTTDMDPHWAFLQKPFSPHALATALEKLLAGRVAVSASRSGAPGGRLLADLMSCG